MTRYNGFIVTHRCQPMTLSKDELWFSNKPITVFPDQKSAEKAIQNTIKLRSAGGFIDDFTKRHFYLIRGVKNV